MTRFICLDVETANASLSSICQIGAVIYENRRLVDQWSTMVNPNQEFRNINIRIHGIRASDVATAPDLATMLGELQCFTGSSIISSYGAFDRSAVSQASMASGLQPPANQWIDLQRVVRNAWPLEFTANGWKLSHMCKQLGISLENHHDALSDAVAAAEVFIQAQQFSNTSASDWLDPARYRNTTTTTNGGNRFSSSVKETPVNQNGPLFGEVIVFTGELSMPRATAAKRAALIGCEPANGVTKRTTLLVVGEQDLELVGESGKSTKQVKAEELIAKGQEIRILGESDFDSFLRQHGL